MLIVPWVIMSGCFALSTLIFFELWRVEVSLRKGWKSEHDKEFAAKLEVIEDRNNLRRANAKLHSKLTRLREALADDAPTP